MSTEKLIIYQEIKNNEKSKRGFTFIELLISSSIILVIILALIQFSIHALILNRRSNYSIESTELVASKLEYLKSLSFDSQELNECFDYELIKAPPLKGYYRREWKIQDLSSRLKKIEVKCYFEACPEKKIKIVLFLSKELGF